MKPILAASALAVLFLPYPALAQKPELVVETGHAGSVLSVAFSPDGRVLASASFDDTVKLWDVMTGRELRTLTGHRSTVNSVAFSPDGRVLASASFDETVKLWDAASGRELRTLAVAKNDIISVLSVAFSPDGRTLASGNWDHTVKLWDVASGRELCTLAGHKGEVRSVAFSPDGQMLASGSEDKTIKLWDVASGRELRSLADHTGAVFEVWSVAFSPDRRMLASGNFDKTIKLWDVASGNKVRSLVVGAYIDSVTFSPDGRTLASGNSDQTIMLWDVAGWRKVYTLTGHTGMVHSIAFSPDGQMLASGSEDKTVKLWDVASGHELRTFVGHIDAVKSLTFSSDRRTLASGGWDHAVKLWDVASGHELRTLVGHKGAVGSVAFSPDGRTLASGNWDQSIKLWEVASGRELRTLTGHTGWVNSVAFSPDGQMLASGSEDNTIKLWDVASGRALRTLTLHARRRKGLTTNSVESVAFSSHGWTLASVCNNDDTIKLWNVARGHKARSLVAGTYVNSVAFSPDGLTLASGGDDYTIKIWDVASGQVLRSLTGHPVSSVAFSPDGRTLASGSVFHTLELWDSASASELRSLISPGVSKVAFSPDGRFLISGGEDGGVRIWNAASVEQLATLISMSGTSDWLVVTPNGLFDGSADAMRHVAWRRVPDTNDTVALDTFYNDFFHPGLLAEIFEGQRPEAPYDLATRLQFPSLRTMAQQGLASIQKRDEKVFLCLAREASSASVEGLRVVGRGQPIDVGTEGFTENKEDSSCTYSKQLPAGEGPYELVGTTTGWKPASADSRVSANRDADVSKATLQVFTTGIDKYVRDEAYPPLGFPVADADAIENFFEQEKESLKKPFAGVQVWKGLRNEAATRRAIRDELAAMAKEVKEDDVVFLFFSGHGRVPPGQEMFYYIPYLPPPPSSAVVVNPIEEREEGLNTAMLAEAIRNLPARRVVLVVDACQSGGAVESLGKIGEVKLAVEERRAKQDKASGRADHSREVGVYILAAATPVQEALEPLPGTGSGSLLTTALLEALNGKNIAAGDDKIWMTTLFERVKQNLRQLAAQHGSIQTAFSVEVGSDFPIAVR